jgi:hypothetical protein
MNQSLQSVLQWVVDTANQADESLADGFQPKDAVDFLGVALRAPAVFKDLPEAIKTIKAGFTEAEQKEINDFVSDKLALKDDETEEKVEALVSWLLDTESLILMFLKKKPALPEAPVV